MKDLSNLNLQSIAENEKSIEIEPKNEVEVHHESTLIEGKNNNSKSKINDNNSISEHKRCVPLNIYQKVYEDKQKLLSEINNLNTEIKNLSQNKILLSLENEIKQLKRDIENYENAIVKQEKYINILKNKISKLEKQIAKKNEEIINKENASFELKDKINELNHKIQNMKEMFKIDSEQELLSKNEEITSLKNKIEINMKKMEFQEKKFQNLQIKYLRLLKNKKNDIFSLNENFSTVNLIKNKKSIDRKYNSRNIENLLFNTQSKLNDDKIDNNRIKTIMDNIDINNINNNININVNNNAEFNTIQNNQRYFSPQISLINKNNDSKNINNLLPVLNNERNIQGKKESKIKLKVIESKNDKNILKKSNDNFKKKEINKIIFTQSNK